MKEIKLRAWDGKQKLMFYFFRMCKPKDSGTLAFECKDIYHEDWEKAEWSDLTVMQATGLSDKNEKEIYDGDILASEGRIIGHIESGVRGYCYDVVYVNPRHDKRWSLYATITHDYEGNIEVIGNIHQNPELLQP